MHFDCETILLAAMLVVAPAVFAIISVKRNVSKFIRDVEAEEQDSGDNRKKN